LVQSIGCIALKSCGIIVYVYRASLEILRVNRLKKNMHTHDTLTNLGIHTFSTREGSLTIFRQILSLVSNSAVEPPFSACRNEIMASHGSQIQCIGWPEARLRFRQQFETNGAAYPKIGLEV